MGIRKVMPLRLAEKFDKVASPWIGSMRPIC
jgi:hypothetical protein